MSSEEDADEATEESEAESDDIEADESENETHQTSFQRRNGFRSTHGLLQTEDEQVKTAEDVKHAAYMKAYKEKQRKELLIVPPPQDLIAKTVYLQEEPVKTGAPISFVGVERLIGLNKSVEAMNKENPDSKLRPSSEAFEVDLRQEVAEIRNGTTQLH